MTLWTSAATQRCRGGGPGAPKLWISRCRRFLRRDPRSAGFLSKSTFFSTLGAGDDRLIEQILECRLLAGIPWANIVCCRSKLAVRVSISLGPLVTIVGRRVYDTSGAAPMRSNEDPAHPSSFRNGRYRGRLGSSLREIGSRARGDIPTGGTANCVEQ